MNKLAIAGLLSGGLKLSKYNEELEAIRFELEDSRIDYRASVEMQETPGLFGLGYRVLFLQRERALLKYARDNRISLQENDWRQRALERIAWNWIDSQARKPRRGRPKMIRSGLLAAATDDDPILDKIDEVRTLARDHGRGDWSDAKCIKFYVSATEFGNNGPSSVADFKILNAHSRTLCNKVSRLRTKLKRKARISPAN